MLVCHWALINVINSFNIKVIALEASNDLGDKFVDCRERARKIYTMRRSKVFQDKHLGVLGMYRTGLAVIWLLVGSTAWGYPKPAVVPSSWELQFDFQSVRRIKIDLPGQGAKTYWYMIYTVTNETGQDVVFHADFTLVTDDLRVMHAGVDVPPAVFKAIKQEYRNTYPWLEHPRDLVGKLGQGKDNARDSVAIWPDFSPYTSQFTIFVSGLSGEAVEVPNPIFVPGTSDPTQVPAKFVLRKTLRIQYRVPTDATRRNLVEASPQGRPAMDWVMR